MKSYLQIFFFITSKNLIQTQYVEDIKGEKMYNIKKEHLAASLLMYNLIIFSMIINLKSVFASK